MPNEEIKPARKGFLAIAVLVLAAIIILPVPALLLDILVSVGLIMAILAIFITYRTKKITDFSLLPSILLVLTIFSLAIQISFTRLILTKGDAFDGCIIRVISALMTAPGGVSGLITGLIIFIVFTFFATMVFARGSTRVAEVAARFTLDSLSIKLMAIDTEYSSGAIDQKEAVVRKETVQKEADFYGSMDGAAKFISGNLKIGFFITAVGIIGGIALGTLYHGETINKAMMTYIPLSIGNGFLALLLVLLKSFIAGNIVINSVKNAEDDKQDIPDTEMPDKLLLELGYGLTPLVSNDEGAELLKRVKAMRRQIALDLGIVIPPVRIIDNVLLKPYEYCIKINGAEAGRKILDRRDEAESAGSTGADQSAIIVTHFTEIIKQHAAEISGLQETQIIADCSHD